MLVPLGQMRDPAVILTPVRGADEFGGEVITYVESPCIFVALRSVTSKEAVEFGQLNADTNFICFGHWHDLSQLTAKDRLKVTETGQEFDILGPPVNDPKKGFTKLNLVLRENG